MREFGGFEVRRPRSLGRVPVEPPPSRYRFPAPETGHGPQGVLGVGGDFEPGTLLRAYRSGIFPWPITATEVPWCSPDPRGVFPLDDPPKWPRTLRKALKKRPFVVTFDEAFAQVIDGCADRAGGTWIVDGLRRGFLELHTLGWAHSVEVWNRDTGNLVGGLYGIIIGRAFAGESMFHREDDASKFAFVALVERLREAGFCLLDVQVLTSHLASMGCVTIPRDEFLPRLLLAAGDSGEISLT